MPRRHAGLCCRGWNAGDVLADNAAGLQWGAMQWTQPDWPLLLPAGLLRALGTQLSRPEYWQTAYHLLKVSLSFSAAQAALLANCAASKTMTTPPCVPQHLPSLPSPYTWPTSCRSPRPSSPC